MRVADVECGACRGKGQADYPYGGRCPACNGFGRVISVVTASGHAIDNAVIRFNDDEFSRKV